MFKSLPVYNRVGYCSDNLNVLFSISLTSLVAVLLFVFTCVTRHKGVVNWNSDDTLKRKNKANQMCVHVSIMRLAQYISASEKLRMKAYIVLFVVFFFFIKYFSV